MYSKDRLIILDADGTTIDAFGAIERTFALHQMDIGDLARFQKRRHLFKYLGGMKEFPSNLKRQLGKQKRTKLIETLTQIYRDEARLYEPIGLWINRLTAQRGLRIGVITCNITNEPIVTLQRLFQRHGIDSDQFDFLVHVPLKQDKASAFQRVRAEFDINPARAYACGDEKKDFLAALSVGMHPFMVSYGFEDFGRLTKKIGIPPELISRTPGEFCAKVCHALDIDSQADASRPGDADPRLLQRLAPIVCPPEPHPRCELTSC